MAENRPPQTQQTGRDADTESIIPAWGRTENSRGLGGEKKEDQGGTDDEIQIRTQIGNKSPASVRGRVINITGRSPIEVDRDFREVAAASSIENLERAPIDRAQNINPSFDHRETQIPARNTGDEDIVPARKDTSNKESGDIISPRNTISPEKKAENTEDKKKEKPFEQKISTQRFIVEAIAVFLFFDGLPLLLTIPDITVVAAFIIEPIKWGIDIFAWLTLLYRFYLLDIQFFDPKAMWRSVMKFFGAPALEAIPVVNAVIPGWTFQYLVNTIPVVFDIKEIIREGGNWAKFLTWIPGLGLEVQAALKALEVAAETAVKK